MQRAANSAGEHTRQLPEHTVSHEIAGPEATSHCPDDALTSGGDGGGGDGGGGDCLLTVVLSPSARHTNASKQIENRKEVLR